MTDPFSPIEDETPIDVSLLCDRTISNRQELNEAEAENIRKAHVKYFAGKASPARTPFTVTWMCRVHEEMFGDVWQYAGQTRRSNLNIGQPWPQVEPQLLELERDLAFWQSNQSFSLLE